MENKQYDLYNKNTDPISYVEKVYASIWDAKNKTSDPWKKNELDQLLKEINISRQELIDIKKRIDKWGVWIEEKIELNSNFIPLKVKNVNEIIHNYNIKLKNQNKKLEESKSKNENNNLKSEITNVIKDNNIIENKLSWYIDSKKEETPVEPNIDVTATPNQAAEIKPEVQTQQWNTTPQKKVFQDRELIFDPKTKTYWYMSKQTWQLKWGFKYEDEAKKDISTWVKWFHLWQIKEWVSKSKQWEWNKFLQDYWSKVDLKSKWITEDDVKKLFINV